MKTRSVTEERGASASRSSLIVAGLLLATLSGCGESGDGLDHLRYATREDRVVIRVPTVEVDELEPAGELDAHLAKIDVLGGKTFDPKTLSKETRDGIRDVLLPMFGTPAEPKVSGSADIDSVAGKLSLDAQTLRKGSGRYRKYCQQCHGTHGDGRGPTGLWIQPHPRDFRSGKFKFVACSSGSTKPSRDDLRKTAREGLKGTSMPSFAHIPHADLDAILSYATHLSLRGEVERRLLLDTEEETGDFRKRAEGLLAKFLGEWRSANDATVSTRPTIDEQDDSESIRRGYATFADDNGGGCLKCHADYGRRARYRFDDWGTLVKPRDLTQAVYRRGSDAEELFDRIRCGIAPSGMPSAEKLGESRLTDLVRFVQAIPFPKRLPPEIRDRIYPESLGKGTP